MFRRLLYSSYLYVVSLAFCLRYLSFKIAFKVPIYISPKVKIGKLNRKSIVFGCEPHRAMLVIGFDGTEGMYSQKSYISVRKGGRIIFNGSAVISRGINLIADGGSISFGHHFFCNNNCRFWSNEQIIIGNDNMYGWNVNFNTSNGHPVYFQDVSKKVSENIEVGNHVWICSYCNVSKSVVIADECIISQGSFVINKHLSRNTLIGGNPAKDIHEGYSWTEF